MPYRVLSWNVEHFSGRKSDGKKVAEHIRTRAPDIFGLYEVEDRRIYDFMKTEFPDYGISITGGAETQEILVGVRSGTFDHTWFEQRLEFKEGNEYLRPGAMLTVSQGSRTDTLLFLHTDSGPEASAFGNRARMLRRAFGLKVRLDEIAGGKANFIVLGDLNTMGLEYPEQRSPFIRVRGDEEVAGLSEWAQSYEKGKRKADMVLLRKDKLSTWTDGHTRSNLDHVLASAQMQFEEMSTDSKGNPAQLRVEGWWGLKGKVLQDFVKRVSDHCSLFFGVTD